MKKKYFLIVLYLFTWLAIFGQKNNGGDLVYRNSIWGKKFLYNNEKICFAEGKKLLLNHDASKGITEKFLQKRKIGRICTYGGYTVFAATGVVVLLKSFTINIFNTVTPKKESYQPTTTEGVLIAMGGATTIFGIIKLISAKEDRKKAIILFNENKDSVTAKYVPHFGITNSGNVGFFVPL